ncbi:hypothetical protein HDZ31DRAFT_81031 [Schizophyllum fasciatum]
MSQPLTFPPTTLPTLDNLGASVSDDDVDAPALASEWFDKFAQAASGGDAAATTELFIDGAYWRDILALTWDFRTFHGSDKIRTFLLDQLPIMHPREFRLRPGSSTFFRQYADLVWVNALFTFETDVGLASGVIRLVPQKEGHWKCAILLTNLEDLKGFPEKAGPHRNPNPNHGLWEAQRKQEVAFENTNPTVLIMGAGQSGLELSARLKALGVSTLAVDKNMRVGDNWRNRYDALCLHDPVWYDHMPYMPFPPTWPVFTPARKLANWLEAYAEALELNIWTGTAVVQADQDPQTGMWNVLVRRADGSERVFHVKYFVFAPGVGDGYKELPKYPGMDEFKGQILHSTAHKRASDHAGKKVVIVGACTSAHDIATDYYRHGIDVTLYQRSSTYIMSTKNGFPILHKGLYREDGPPVDVADRLNAAFPNLALFELSKRMAIEIADADRELLEGLNRVGFRTNMGYKDAGFLLLAWERAGGYYLDVGASQLIIDGKIKLKSGPQIESFTPTGLKFDDGSELPADVVVFATGIGEVRNAIRRVCGDELTSRVKKIWGLDEEGELQGCYRDLGLRGMFCMMGNLALCRFHSKHVALQIKAMEEGVFGQRYSLDSKA